MVFGEAIRKVSCSSLPMCAVLALADAIDFPTESHVHGLGAFFFDSFIGDSVCCCGALDSSFEALNLDEFELV